MADFFKYSKTRRVWHEVHLPKLATVNTNRMVLNIAFDHFFCNLLCICWLNIHFPLPGELEPLTADQSSLVPGDCSTLEGHWHTVYLLQLVSATMITICEAAGKQMLFFHLWNQVVGKYSGFQCRKPHLINLQRQCEHSQKYLTTVASISD